MHDSLQIETRKASLRFNGNVGRSSTSQEKKKHSNILKHPFSVFITATTLAYWTAYYCIVNAHNLCGIQNLDTA